LDNREGILKRRRESFKGCSHLAGKIGRRGAISKWTRPLPIPGPSRPSAGEEREFGKKCMT